MNIWTVYMHRNKINNKKYIGITSCPVLFRWGTTGGQYLHKKNNKYTQPLFARAILKYGWNNFEHIILYTHMSEKEAKQKETELILKYHTYCKDPKCWGYNETLGGDGLRKYKNWEESIAAYKANTKKWYINNRQQVINKAKQYAKEHEQEIAGYRKAYQAIHRKKINEQCRVNYLKNKKQALFEKKKYYLKNKDKILKYKSQLGKKIRILRKKVLELSAKYPTILDDIDKIKLKCRDTCRNKAYLESLLQKFSKLTLN